MPVQSIDLSAVTDATFNGVSLDAINLNGSEIWAGGINISPLGSNVHHSSWNMMYVIPHLYVDGNGDIYIHEVNAGVNAFNQAMELDIITGTKTLDGRTVSQYPLISFDSNGNLKSAPVQKFNITGYNSYGNIQGSYLVATTNASAQTLHINRSPNSYETWAGGLQANGHATYTWDVSSKSFSVVSQGSTTDWAIGVTTSFPPGLTIS